MYGYQGISAAGCPPTLSSTELRETGFLQYKKIMIDGASLMTLKSHPNLIVTDKPPYVRYTNNKNACWYASPYGHIGLIEK